MSVILNEAEEILDKKTIKLEENKRYRGYERYRLLWKWSSISK